MLLGSSDVAEEGVFVCDEWRFELGLGLVVVLHCNWRGFDGTHDRWLLFTSVLLGLEVLPDVFVFVIVNTTADDDEKQTR